MKSNFLKRTAFKPNDFLCMLFINMDNIFCKWVKIVKGIYNTKMFNSCNVF